MEIFHLSLDYFQQKMGSYCLPFSTHARVEIRSTTRSGNPQLLRSMAGGEIHPSAQHRVGATGTGDAVRHGKNLFESF